MKFCIHYQPERWPLLGRAVMVEGRVYDASGNSVFSITSRQGNNAGLIGAVAGPSRDDLVANTARDDVTKVVNEMRKGTKNNTPIAAGGAATQTSTVAIAPTTSGQTK